MAIPYGGDRLAIVDEDLAARFQAGDRLIILQDTGDLLHVPAAEQAIAHAAVSRAQAAFARMGEVRDDQISAFFEAFAARLADDAVWGTIATANSEDLAAAQSRGRSTTRLTLSDQMRGDMIAVTKISGGQFRIATLRPDGRGERVVTTGRHDEAPSWASNGRAIVFTRIGRDAALPELWMVDLIGNASRRLETPQGGSDPSWSSALK
ncbi:MAG: hypothetical protein B7Z13_09815 [Caulobacterales bacterium 32-67-6]|nr:MAG: hypothetical protein B7Z13_09815 [Caulobacterales bacterium 32-67-6]